MRAIGFLRITVFTDCKSAQTVMKNSLLTIEKWVLKDENLNNNLSSLSSLDS